MEPRIFLRLGLLKRLQDLVPDRDGVGQALQPRRKPFEFVMPKVTVGYAGCQDQVIVRYGHSCPVPGIDQHTLLVLVYARNFAQDHHRVLLFPENAPDRRAYLPRS